VVSASDGSCGTARGIAPAPLAVPNSLQWNALETIRDFKTDIAPSAQKEEGEPGKVFRMRENGNLKVWQRACIVALRKGEHDDNLQHSLAGICRRHTARATRRRDGFRIPSISGTGDLLLSANESDFGVPLEPHFGRTIWVDGSYGMVAAQEQIEYGLPLASKLHEYRNALPVVRHVENWLSLRHFQSSASSC